MAVLNSFILLKKKNTLQTKTKMTKDSVHDCVQKITIACIFLLIYCKRSAGVLVALQASAVKEKVNP
jgi:hypothetical protein